MFDFANQSYTLLIITVVFGTLFTQVIVGERPMADGGGDGFRHANLLWSLALGISYMIAVLTAPLFGAMMDHASAKMRFLFASYVLTVLTTAMLFFVAPGLVVLGMVLIVLSNTAYTLGESFIASFLPSLGPPEDLGKISGFGWALGYVGGLVASVFALLVLGEVSAANFDRARLVGPLAAAFFLVAALPTFLLLREPRPAHQAGSGTPWQGIVLAGFMRVIMTLGHLRRHRDLSIFLISLFFTMSGIYIIIAFSFIYGAQVIGWDESARTFMFLVVQVTAVIGALGFGFIQDRLGARPTYIMTLVLWLFAIAAIYLTPDLSLWLQDHAGLAWEAQYVFVVVGSLAGLSLGSSQSSGRALVAMLAPADRAAEFFGFWGLATKLAACFGLFSIGMLQIWLGLHRSILFCLALFAVAILVCLFVDTERGRRAALAAENGRGGA